MTEVIRSTGEGAGRALDLRRLALTALSVLFGMQTLRALVPLTVFVLRDRFGWHAAGVGLAMLTVFATGFLAAPACRAVGSRRFLQLTAGGLALARLALQLPAGDPVIDLGLAVVATVLFFFALPALAGVGVSPPLRRRDGAAFVLGWLVGLAADTALHGAYGTWDMIWRSDAVGLATLLVLVGCQWRLLNLAGDQAAGTADDAPRPAWTWTAFGPLLFLELLVLGNVARLATLAGWPVEAAALSVLAGRILACWAVVWSVARGRRLESTPAAGLALALLASVVVAWPRGVPAALLVLGGQVSAAMLWTRIVLAAGDDRPRRLTASHGVALLAFGILLFLYYGGIDIRLPFGKDLLAPVAAFAIGLAAIAARSSSSSPEGRPPMERVHVGHAWLGLAVLLAPALIQLASTWSVGAPAARPELRAGDAAGFPLRIMTYNLHLGIDPRGRLDLERIAATIEAEDPDVVALQEVSRGWVINGSADVLAWLSRRLGMHYVFAGTADPLWGNAVLSRRPLLRIKALPLPTEELLIRRGLLTARIGLGATSPLEVIVTHHHHKRDGGAVRELQSRAILDLWQGARRTAILGDFNARPGEPEIEMMRDAGFRDVLDLAGVEPGYTNPATRPVQRIDYIWISPDLTASEVAIPPDPASDHLPVVATLDLKKRR